MPGSARKYMDLREMLDEGFVQEANRLFFHPRGLALAVGVDRFNRPTELTVWDYRDDPEGIIFGEGVIESDKVVKVEAELERHTARRLEALNGSVVQPVPDDRPEDES